MGTATPIIKTKRTMSVSSLLRAVLICSSLGLTRSFFMAAPPTPAITSASYRARQPVMETSTVVQSGECERQVGRKGAWNVVRRMMGAVRGGDADFASLMRTPRPVSRASRIEMHGEQQAQQRHGTTKETGTEETAATPDILISTFEDVADIFYAL